MKRVSLKRGMRSKRWRKRTTRKRTGIRSKFAQVVQYFTRSAYFGNELTATTTAPVYNAWQFKLTDVPNYTDFTNLYDMYQIRGVEIELIPQANSVEVGNASGPCVHSALDYNDPQLPTSVAELCQFENYKMTRGLRSHKRYVRPKMMDLGLANVTPATVITTGYSKNQWINTNTPDVRHYGIKFVIDQIQSGSERQMNFDVRLKYYLAFKQVQ